MKWIMLGIKNKPLVAVLKVQLFFILAITIVFGYWLGLHGAISAVLGGGINFLAGVVFGLIISGHQGFLPDEVIKTALKAEVFKITVIVFLLWMVFKFYSDVVPTVFIGVFTLTVLLHSAALFVVNEK